MNKDMQLQRGGPRGRRRVPLPAWVVLVAAGGVVTGIFTAWVFAGRYTDYRAFPTVFVPPKDFSVASTGVLLAAAGGALFFSVAWVLCGLLSGEQRAGPGQHTRKDLQGRLAADARVFLSPAVPGAALILVAAGSDLGIAALFIFIAAVTPPLALLLYRAAMLATGCPAPKRRGPAAILALMTASFCVFFSIQTIHQYHALNLGYADSGYVAEALSNTLRGRFLWCNSLEFGNYLGDHFSPILLFLVPLYALWPVHETLLAAHALAIGLAAIPVYLLVRRTTQSNFAGVALAAAYLLHPAVQFQNTCFSYGFKAASLGIPLLLWAMYFTVARRDGLFVVFSLLSLACEESLVPIVLSLGAYAALSRKMRTGWLIAGVAAGWWVAATQFVMPRISGSAASKQLRTFYGWMDGSPGKIIEFIVRHPVRILKRFLRREVFVFAAQMSFPVGMLSFLSPAAAAVGVVTFVFLVLSSEPVFLSIYFQYKAGLIPVVFFAAALAMGKLCEWQDLKAKRWLGGDPARASGCVALVAAAASCFVFGPTPLSHNYVPSFYRAGRYAAIREVRKMVPPEAALLASERAAAHFTGQALLHRLRPRPTAEYDFVLLDLDDTWDGREKVFAERKNYLSDPRFAPVYARDGFILFQKGGRVPHALAGFGPQDPHMLDKLPPADPIPVGDVTEIAHGEFGRPPPDVPSANVSVLVYWKCLKQMKTDRACALTIIEERDGEKSQFNGTFHPCRGLFPTSMWKPGMIIADRYDIDLPFELTEAGARFDFQWVNWAKKTGKQQ